MSRTTSTAAVPDLARDGGERQHVTLRPMTPDEIVAFADDAAEQIAQALDVAPADVTAIHKGGGELRVSLWKDDEEGGVVTFLPVTAVRS